MPGLEDAVEQIIVVSHVYTYKNIDMHKLERYEGFLNKPDTAKFNAVVTDSMIKEVETAIFKLAIALGLVFSSEET